MGGLRTQATRSGTNASCERRPFQSKAELQIDGHGAQHRLGHMGLRTKGGNVIDIPLPQHIRRMLEFSDKAILEGFGVFHICMSFAFMF